MSKILVIDDDPKVREILYVDLKELGFNVFLAASGKEGLSIVEDINPDLVICDLVLPDESGIQVLEKVREYDNFIQVILMTGYYDTPSIIKALKKGSFDFLQKPVEINQLKHKILRALEIQNISQHLNSYTISETEEYKLENNLVGRTPRMREVANDVQELSSKRVSVLITGERGTGKVLIAKILHFTGISKDKPFIAINCSALSENMIESELFGNIKGAFKGADREKKGKFELANEGTIFLDGISELSKNLQTKLFSVIENREVKKIGSKYPIPMRARILTASNNNLEELVENGSFRKDLYDRLNVFRINLPPLRERKADIPIIVTHFLRKINDELHKNVKKVPIEVMEYLEEYDWPGNVRELKNILYQAIMRSNNDELLKENILINRNSKINIESYDSESLEEVEKRHIIKILNKVKGDKNHAIKILGISKPTLYSKLKKYSLYN